MPHKSTRKTTIGGSSISIGRFTYGWEHITVRQWDEGAPLDVGSFCSIAGNVQIFLGGNHRMDWITTYPFGHTFPNDFGGPINGHPKTNGGVSIGHDVWIGQGATIMSGITIGDGAVIAANATVSKNISPYEVVGGNPACHIKFRFNTEIIELLLRLKWWNLSLEDIKKIMPRLCCQPTSQDLKELIHLYY